MAKYKVISCESEPGGRFLKLAMYDVVSGITERGVTAWPEFSQYGELAEGVLVEGIISLNGKYKNLKNAGAPVRQAPGGVSRGAGIAVAQEKKAEGIRNAQDNKELGIKISGAQRDAVLIATTFYTEEVNALSAQDKDLWIEKKIEKWRKYFLEAFDGSKERGGGEIPF